MCFGALSGVSSSWQTLGCLNISQGMVLQFVFPCIHVCNSKLPSPRIVAHCSKGPFQVVGACSRFMVVWLCSLWGCSWKDPYAPTAQQPLWLWEHHQGVVPAVAILAEIIAGINKTKSFKCTGQPKFWLSAGESFALAGTKLQASNQGYAQPESCSARLGRHWLS